MILSAASLYPKLKEYCYSRRKVLRLMLGNFLILQLQNATMKEGKVDIDNMFVDKVFADDGPIMKRFRPRAQGRATVIRRRTCHITLHILDKEEEATLGTKS